MTTKINHPVFCIKAFVRWSFFSGLSSVVRRLASVILLLSTSVWAGDLTVDNLTVSNAVAVGGTISIGGSVMTGTNGAMATGGTITTDGSYIIHTFTNVGTTNFVVSGGSLTCDVLIVAGGGGGAGRHGGGGGAGGLIYTNINISGTNAATVGAGGGGSPGNEYAALETTKGEDSVAFGLTAIGGGAGSGGPTQTGTGGSGGGGHAGHQGFNGTSGQGYAGGAGIYIPNPYDYLGGGGGGAGGVGGNASSGILGAAGAGLSKSISGSAITYAVGGTGSSYISATVGSAGTVNTGNGGNAGGGDFNPGGYGGSGIVIVRYAMTTSSNITSLSISSNGISQTRTSGVNVLMGKVGIGTNNPAEKLHVAGNMQVDGSLKLGGEPRTNWPNVAVGALIASNNLSDVVNKTTARANLGLGTAATNDASAFDPAGSAGAFSNTLSAHTANLNNPHQVTASQVGALTPTGNGSQLTGITAGQVGALTPNGNGSQLSGITASQVGALSTNGGAVNGSLDITGSIAVGAPAGDIPMGVYTNQ